MKIAYYQFCPKFNDTKYNVDKVLSKIDEIKADILVLPELFTCGYSFVSREKLQEQSFTANSEIIEVFKSKAEAKNMVIYGGFPEFDNGKIYNSAFLVGDSFETIIYRKIHLFEDEKDVFDVANNRLETHKITVNGETICVGLMICFDWIFPETARSLALGGAQILLHCANLVLPYCPSAMITRCIENRVFAVTCNRIGQETNGSISNKFIGLSQIVGHKGNLLVRSPEDEEDVQIQEIDFKQADNKIVATKNHLFEDRRADLYTF